MTPAQYLAACKTKLGHCSDYALAKKWEFDKGYMSKVIRGKTPINARMAYCIAITLELDPSTVLADIERQQQTGKVGAFWQSFFSRLTHTLLVLLVLLGASAGTVTERAAHGGFKRRVSFG